MSAEDEFPLVPFLFGPDGENLYDSTAIAEWFDQRTEASRRLLPDDPVAHFVAALIDDYADEFGLYMVHHNRWKVSALDNDASARLVRELGIPWPLKQPVMARWQRGLRKLLARPALQDDVLSKVKTLSARGTGTLLLVTEDDDGRDYLEFHFGRRGSYLRDDPNFKMVLVQNSDHTFTDEPSLAFVTATLKAHLDKATCLQAGKPASDCLQTAGAADWPS